MNSENTPSLPTMTDKIEAPEAASRCWFGHRWTMWAMVKIHNPSTYCDGQRRRCLGCGLLELRRF